jgi:ABC-type phosphate transport system permease subunit
MEVEPTPQVVAATITNGMYKFAGYASVLLAADYLVPSLYGSLWPMFYTVAFLTAVGLIADLTVLPRLGNVPSLCLGFFGVLFIVWMTPKFWPANHVTLLSAFVLTVCIVPLEYALHKYVLRAIR